MIKAIENKIIQFFNQEIEIKRQDLKEDTKEIARKIQNEIEHKGGVIDVLV